MARRAVKTRTCDRCPYDKSVGATHLDVPLQLGQVKWLLDLCEKHHVELDRVAWSWGRLGREVETAVRFGSEYREDARRLAELRTSQAQPAAVASAAPTKRALHLSGPIPAGLPADANEWVFSEHAKERMDQRSISALAALRAACTPRIQRPGRTDDTMVYETEGVRVVVNPDTKEIITAARSDSYSERKAL